MHWHCFCVFLLNQKVIIINIIKITKCGQTVGKVWGSNAFRWGASVGPMWACNYRPTVAPQWANRISPRGFPKRPPRPRRYGRPMGQPLWGHWCGHIRPHMGPTPACYLGRTLASIDGNIHIKLSVFHRDARFCCIVQIQVFYRLLPYT